MKLVAAVFLTVLLLSSTAFAQGLPDSPPGRYLPNGHYLARNFQAASSDTPIYNPYWPVVADWGPEICI